MDHKPWSSLEMGIKAPEPNVIIITTATISRIPVQLGRVRNHSRLRIL